MDEYKRAMSAVDANSIISMGNFVAPTLLSMGVRAALQAGQIWAQAVTTNVPGPRVPLYVLGRRMTSATAYVPIAGGTRCSIGIFSYLNTMTFGINADFDAFPDVDVLSGGIRRGIEQLLALATKKTEAAVQAEAAAEAVTEQPAPAPAEEKAPAQAAAKKAPAKAAPKTPTKAAPAKAAAKKAPAKATGPAKKTTAASAR
jgi:hypothetical protein